MENIELLKTALEFGIAGAIVVVLFIVYKIIQSYNIIQGQMLAMQEVSHNKLVMIMNERAENDKIEREKSKSELARVEHRLNEQCDEQLKLKEQIAEMKIEIEDKDKKIARLILQIDEYEKAMKKKDEEIDAIKKELSGVAQLKKELAEVRSERDDLKKRLIALEALQKDGEAKT